MDGVQVAVVTGASSGIGLATVERLREAGLRVVGLDVDAGADVVADVGDVASVSAAFAAVLRTYGRVDLLVNNAGIGGGPAAGLCHETPVEVFDRVQAVNLRGPFLCTRAVLPGMLERGSGRIVTIASVNSAVVLPGRCAYTTSKGGALMFARSVAVDYGHLGIRSNAVCPGLVRTPLVAARLDAGAWDVERLVPLGRPAEPYEIADAVEALASGRLDYVNGAALYVDGGWTAV